MPMHLVAQEFQRLLCVLPSETLEQISFAIEAELKDRYYVQSEIETEEEETV